MKIEFKMVLQVCADTRTVGNQLDTVLTQLLCRTNARNLEQLHRIDRTAGQNDFAGCANLMPLAAAFIFNANRTLAFKKDARCQRFFDDPQIGPFARTIEIGFGGRAARAISCGHIHPAKALLPKSVIVFG